MTARRYCYLMACFLPRKRRGNAVEGGLDFFGDVSGNFSVRALNSVNTPNKKASARDAFCLELLAGLEPATC